ncbi:DUF1761 domain-containing protein [Sphingomonas xanthus]|uniref:DUF1761 domain-containing protein n=1 Tax=Sphingomonas xanthus TaxID=2594473 RepID=A0A516IT23_9SPHN|nr:DUF1761 domain-containing protein [Sphingomonas xanthus]QDP19974.1 DUF1761 domain-containing protein [Sphingomonas xanthus]
MEFGDLNWAAVLVAAVAIYAIGFIIYGLLMKPDKWMRLARITEEDMTRVGKSRMIYGPLMPLVTAIFMALLFHWAGVSSWQMGLHWGAAIAVASALPALWYGWVYGVGPAGKEMLDSVHLLLGHVAAGAILGGWQ